MNKNAMHNLTYGLFVLTAEEGGKHNGCIINTVTQVTSQPNRITIAVNKSNYTHDMIKRTGKFTVSVIGENADFELFKHFGFQSGKDTDKFENYNDAKKAANGTMIVTSGTNAYISAKVISETDLGSHTLFLADVTESEVLGDVPSASYDYYQKNIKPKPEAAPENKGKTVWRCTVCGYEYIGEELPEDFVCPLCLHPAEDFEKVVV